MVHHVRRNHNRRDDGGIPAAPTGLGLTSASIAADTAETTAASLALNSAAVADVNTDQAVQFSTSATNTFTSSLTNETDPADAAPPSASAAPSPSSSDISLGTVIGVCLAALAGAVLLILIGLWLYKRGTRPRRRPSIARKPADKDRTWGKLDDDHEDKWEGQNGRYLQKGVGSVAPMEQLTVFKNPTPPTFSKSPDQESVPSVAPFAHPFAQYTPDLAKEFAENGTGAVVDPPKRPFLDQVAPIAPISWDGDNVGRDSFLSLSSNPAISQTIDMAIPTPQLTSSEPHHWQSAVVMNFDPPADETQRGRPAVAEPRKSSNNPFFGARASIHSTHSRSQSRSRTPSISTSYKSSAPDAITMPTPPAIAYTREEKGKYRVATPPSPASSRAPSTITAHNPFDDPSQLLQPTSPITPIVPFKPDHVSQDSQDRAMASLLAALGPSATHAQVQERLRVASMNASILTESVYTETDGDDATLHQSWPVPPGRS
ncbi:hypothetical protein GGX14DRAFT_418208 [Mycena pura]|uniref:Uncharacterized protein n=1 Tax=Mycena pura TaxID=153505 RepID=A0AAD7E3V3_9AGAR|nr:hypothetical protein GGX14DRAFT_418208 [Mycena pura]